MKCTNCGKDSSTCGCVKTPNAFACSVGGEPVHLWTRADGNVSLEWTCGCDHAKPTPWGA